MNRWKHSGIMLAAALLTTGLVGTAFAAPPAECATGRDRRGYEAGLRTGDSIVNRAWLSVDEDFDRLELFSDAVVDGINLVAPMFAGSSYGDCRLQGFVDGAWERLGEIQREVIGVCLQDGAMWGKIVGALYCSLSQDLGGLESDIWLPRPPTTWCGLHFQARCDEVFRNRTRFQCHHYTHGHHFSVWNEYRNNECMY